MTINKQTSFEPVKPKFSDLLAQPEVKERWEKVRKFFFLRESTYDMSNRCNLRCDGCYYYEGEKQFAAENGDPEAWRQLMQDRDSTRHYLCCSGRSRTITCAGAVGGLLFEKCRWAALPPMASKKYRNR